MLCNCIARLIHFRRAPAADDGFAALDDEGSISNRQHHRRQAPAGQHFRRHQPAAAAWARITSQISPQAPSARPARKATPLGAPKQPAQPKISPVLASHQRHQQHADPDVGDNDDDV